MKTNTFSITISTLFLSLASPMLAMESKDKGNNNNLDQISNIVCPSEKKLHYLKKLKNDLLKWQQFLQNHSNNEASDINNSGTGISTNQRDSKTIFSTKNIPFTFEITCQHNIDDSTQNEPIDFSVIPDNSILDWCPQITIDPNILDKESYQTLSNYLLAYIDADQLSRNPNTTKLSKIIMSWINIYQIKSLDLTFANESHNLNDIFQRLHTFIETLINNEIGSLSQQTTRSFCKRFNEESANRLLHELEIGNLSWESFEQIITDLPQELFIQYGHILLPLISKPYTPKNIIKLLLSRYKNGSPTLYKKADQLFKQIEQLRNTQCTLV